jgi:hypothetical protein
VLYTIQEKPIINQAYYKNNSNTSSMIYNPMMRQNMINDPDNQILTVNDFIDSNEINEGIVYIQGGIGLHQQQRAS